MLTLSLSKLGGMVYKDNPAIAEEYHLLRMLFARRRVGSTTEQSLLMLQQ